MKKSWKSLLSMMVFVCLFNGVGYSGDYSANTPNIPVKRNNHRGRTSMVVARVNDTEIPLSRLMKMMNRVMMREYKNVDITEQVTSEIRQKALDQLVFEELAYQKAQRLGVSVEQKDIELAMATIKRNLGGSENHYRAYLKKNNLTEEHFLSRVERHLTIQLVIEKEITDKIEISDKAMRREYERTKETFIQPAKLFLTDVIFFLNPDDHNSLSKTHRLRQIIAEELDNEPRKLTPDGTFIVRDLQCTETNEPGLFKSAKGLKEGELSDTITVDGTLHIIKLHKFSPKVEITFDQARPHIERKLKAPLQQEKLKEWKNRLIREADIETFDFNE